MAQRKSKKAVVDQFLSAEPEFDQEVEEAQVTYKEKQHPNAGKLQPGFTRYTVIVDKDILRRVKLWAVANDYSFKDTFCLALEEFIDNHGSEIPEKLND
jgi:hypothetical protein